MVFVFESHGSLLCRPGAHVDEPPPMAVWIDKAVRIHEAVILRLVVGRAARGDRCVVGYDDARCGLTVRLERYRRPNNEERALDGNQLRAFFPAWLAACRRSDCRVIHLSLRVQLRESRTIIAQRCVSDGHSDKRTKNGGLRAETKPPGFRVVPNEPPQSVIYAPALSAQPSALSCCGILSAQIRSSQLRFVCRH